MRPPLILAPLLFSGVLACSKRAEVPAEAGASAVAQASAAPGAPASEELPFVATGLERPRGGPQTTGEAPRASLPSGAAALTGDPRLAPHEPAIRRAFGGALPPVVESQEASLSAGRRALLLSGEASDGDAGGGLSAMVLTFETSGRLLWAKPRAVAGVLPPVTHVAIAAGPAGRVALAFCDPPTRTMALRQWDYDGSPFADMQLLHVDACDALAALYWPSQGWVVAASGPFGARAQRVGEDGALVWGGNGLALGAAPSAQRDGDPPARAASPLTLVVDTATSLAVAQRTGDGHVRVYRYDPSGLPLWERPADLGVDPGAGAGRVRVRRIDEGRLMVDVGERVVELRTVGETRRR